MSPDDFDEEDEEVEVWPCSWPAFRVFEALSTQWRVGVRGATGLDYTALPVTARMLGIAARSVFDDIRVMEAAALKQISQSGQSQ
ncbi:DUF1799 domain-containing protein [Pseudomonas sp. G34]|uniref:DUF1799 domain-containing protein n=1 Tax=Pseudomonas sp. G34 TaxID=3059083 RepID=UPI00280721C2|nr:DUF1799 domain-containing protein [Pseudomonas sp. G34]MDQ7987074.1 DUF1799 domain-containing protein [Pseudomonas sp. G34]